ncbi:MAG: hypothetical protein ABW277_13160 [Longimicrobiaceae bacterium]
MKKIRLDLESLEVESFVTSALPRPHGTVWGAEGQVGPQSARCYSVDCESGMCVATGNCPTAGAPDPNCLIYTAGQDTCQATCEATCDFTCQNCNVTDTCPGVLGC